MRMEDETDRTAVIVVDHGSRRSESNDLLLTAAGSLARESRFDIVEPAHMELAEPSIAAAFRRCVERGARTIVVFPWFLSPGRHWHEDIPRLVNDAAADYPEVRWMVTAPFGVHPAMLTAAEDRIMHCLRPQDDGTGCDICGHHRHCVFRRGDGRES